MATYLSRLGAFSARHRVLVFVVWGLMLAVGIVGTVTGMRFSDGGFSLSNTESGRALEVMRKQFPATATDDTQGTLQLVLTAPDGQKITSAASKRLVATAIDGVAGVDHVASVSKTLVSADGTTAVATVTLTGLTDDTDTEPIYEQVLAVADQARDAGLGAEVGGSIGDQTPAQSPAEGIGAMIAFVILIVTFGSLVAAGANMIGALLGLATGLLGVFALSAWHPIGATTPTLAGMIGLAVGIDYGLFILARFRTELREGRTVDEAIARSIGTAGSAVVFAGATVVIALVGLAVVRIPFITEMGVAAAVTVATTVLMALTFLPALMRSMGYRVLSRRERRLLKAGVPLREQATQRAQRRSLLDRWIRTVVRAPLPIAVVAIAALLALSLPTFSLKTALSTPGGEDPDSTQRAAYQLIADKFGPGTQGTLIVLVEGDSVADKVNAVTTTIKGLDDVASATAAGVSKDGSTAMIQVVPDSGPIDDATRDLVRDIRDHAGDVAGVTLAVTGSTAIDIDINDKLNKALIVYLILVVSLSLVLLVILFRSLLVPLVGTLGFLLSLGTAFGVTVKVFQDGWADALIPAPSGNPILSLLPILIVGILFGLAMDYQVFLVSRMHEAHARGLSPADAIVDGFTRTAVVVVAAAAIMVAVFAGFATAVSPFVAAIGFALSVGVLADAFIVRMIIVPAVLKLLGNAAWWMPRWLDRMLPNIDAEGRALEAADQPGRHHTGEDLRTPAGVR
ncbi:RND superfamily putative drug exporter [Actinoplanes lutulentus]|uniref:RND superfamily putative drug exporter n=1 Tax=Actinoplanes lutulentus TaxID=1287878 RepID=A0A327ZB06_9ACTN|nr:MMPL family transporter [Actinoplanes lutulentus]MBB2947405.1 RND superfamily putative drug exporter [Actinoplanes lutulentus]RAK36679.1 RND superfamily putative drug exporter [Actinoplanes lutulentus]